MGGGGGGRIAIRLPEEVRAEVSLLPPQGKKEGPGPPARKPVPPQGKKEGPVRPQTETKPGPTQAIRVSEPKKGEGQGLTTRTTTGRQQSKIGKRSKPDISKKLDVIITRPKDKENVSGIIELKVEVSGGRGKVKTSVQMNGTSIGEIRGREGIIRYDTTKNPNRNYRLTAKARDAAGNKSTKSIQITTRNLVH